MMYKHGRLGCVMLCVLGWCVMLVHDVAMCSVTVYNVVMCVCMCLCACSCVYAYFHMCVCMVMCVCVCVCMCVSFGMDSEQLSLL